VPLSSVKVEVCTRIEKARLVSLARLATACWGAQQASMGLICRWKAPWVQPTASFFAEGCLKRPWRITLAWFTAGELVKCPRLSGAMGGWHLQPCTTTSLRQKVPEPIGLGLSLRFERSRRRACT
jgi:hypothetical protein